MFGDDDEWRIKIASFRYRVIADAAELEDDGGVTAEILLAASRSYLDYAGCSVSFDKRTLWRYLGAYRKRGLLGLMPKVRKDAGVLRAISEDVLDEAAWLRRKKPERPTKTLIDILERTKKVEKKEVARSTLDRHLARKGASRRQLHQLGEKPYRQILTEAPFELVMADFHHGPYVRLGTDDRTRRALLLAFIDHFSRYVVEARYYLHEDFAALRFGLRRLLAAHGLFQRLYVDNGPSFQAGRFHAGCKNEAINIEVVHSKPYVAEGRGGCERFNETLKYQFEIEARGREQLLTLDELNAFLEAWLAERYHQDVNSETGETPLERFSKTQPRLRSAPTLDVIDELFRLRKKPKVHAKWSTVEVNGTRYVVDPALRGLRVQALYDPFEPSYVLIERDGKIIQRAERQKPGQPAPSLPAAEKTSEPDVDYLELLRRDYEARTQAELSGIRLRPKSPRPELGLVDLVVLVEACRGALLSTTERSEVGAVFRRLRPLDPDAARAALEGAQRRLGTQLHVRVYLDALQTALLRQRTRKGESKS